MFQIKWQFISQEIKEVISRFPLTVICSFLFCIIAISLVEIDSEFSETHEVLIKCLLCLALAFIYTIFVKICKDSHKLPQHTYWLLQGLGLLAIIGFYFWIPDLSEREFPIRLFSVFSGVLLALHLFVTVVPYVKKEHSLSDFWIYNKTLLIRFFEASFFTVVLFAGLSIALVSIEKLFDISFRGLEVYVDLAIFLFSVVHPFFFLSRFPNKFNGLELEEPSKAYLIFSKFILIPIVVTYFIILYLYSGKIIAAWNWPRGWVSSLTLLLSGIGILTYLLNYKTDLFSKPKLVVFYKKYFFPLLLPLLFLLSLAIYTRVSEYGITERRYIGMVFTLWLFVITLYIIFSKKDDIRILPLSLSIFMLLSVIGPWNMNRISISSQLSSLENILMEKGLVDEMGFTGESVKLNQKESNRISSIMSYLRVHNKLDLMSKWNSEQLILSPNQNGKLDQNTIRNQLQIEDQINSVDPNQLNYFTNHQYYDLSSYNHMLIINQNLHKNQFNPEAPLTFSGNFDFEENALLIYKLGQLVDKVSLTKVVNSLTENPDIFRNNERMTDPEDMAFELDSKDYDLKLYMDDINFVKSNNGKWQFKYGFGRLLLREKD